MSLVVYLLVCLLNYLIGWMSHEVYVIAEKDFQPGRLALLSQLFVLHRRRS